MMILQRFLPLNYGSRYYSISFNVASMLYQRKQKSSLIVLPQQLTYRNCFLLLKSIFKTTMQIHSLNFSHSVSEQEVKKLRNLISEKLESFDEVDNEELENILAYLLSKGYTRKDIEEKFLEYLNSKDICIAKFSLLGDIDSDIELLLPLLSLSKVTLKLAAENARTEKLDYGNFRNRIYYLSHHFDIEPSVLIPALVKHPSLLTMSFKKLNDKVNILKSANINSEYIVKDLWIFNYTEKSICSRIQAALEAGVELKPWMLRSSEKIFRTVIVKSVEAQRILGNETVHSYLAKRLNCSVEYVDYLMERNKLLKKIHVTKLHQIINFLYEKGYTPQEVRMFPRVFCSSVQSLEKTYEDIKQIKSTLPTLAQLCMRKAKRVSPELKEER